MFFKTQEQNTSNHITISHSLNVESDLTWSLAIQAKVVQCPALAEHPERLTHRSLLYLLHKINSLKECPGHPDKQFVQMAKAKDGVFMSQATDSPSAVLCSNGPYCLNGQMYDKTAKSTSC